MRTPSLLYQSVSHFIVKYEHIRPKKDGSILSSKGEGAGFKVVQYIEARTGTSLFIANFLSTVPERQLLK